MSKINIDDVRPLQNKFAAKCVVCKEEIQVGLNVYYHIKFKKVLHRTCIMGDIEEIAPVKRPKIWGLYTQTEIIAAAHELNATEETIWKSLKRVGVETTPSTYSTISTTISDIKRGTLKPATLRAQHIDLLRKTIAAVLGGEDTTTPDLTPAPASNGMSKEDFDARLHETLTKIGYVTKAAMEEAVAEVKKYQPIEVVIKAPPKVAVNAGIQHYMFPTLLEYIALGHNVWLVGPAGAGKTQGARNVAKHLKMKYFSKSCYKEMTPTSLLGYMDAQGRYVSTSFREAFEKGGLFLFDEVDKCNSGTLAAFNDCIDAKAGDLCSFPDKMVVKSKDFLAVAGANTFGSGANRVYISSMQQDGASLDRFTFLEWGYDEALELHIAGGDDWTKRVQAYRRAADNLGIRHIISPRASIKGNQALKKGRPTEEVENSVIWKGLDEQSIDKIKKEVSKLDLASKGDK